MDLDPTPTTNVGAYRAVQWGVGPGLLVCEFCGAVVFPDPDADFDLHADWHADTNDALAEMYDHLHEIDGDR